MDQKPIERMEGTWNLSPRNKNGEHDKMAVYFCCRIDGMWIN